MMSAVGASEGACTTAAPVLGDASAPTGVAGHLRAASALLATK